ncbi:hypothetical protein ACVK1X_002509 [Pseudomonas sp. PvR086]
MGYADQLTGHGMRATISTALNEIGYPKVWVDAQLSHADPDKVSAAYNHAEYVEQRRTMMQDWANRLDLWGQGKPKAASSPLTIRLEGAASLPLLENATGNAVLCSSSFAPATAPSTMLVSSEKDPIGSIQLPVVPAPAQTEKLTTLTCLTSSVNGPKCWPRLRLQVTCRCWSSPDWQVNPAIRSIARSRPGAYCP